jgi:hypothetical protein
MKGALYELLSAGEQRAAVYMSPPSEYATPDSSEQHEDHNMPRPIRLNNNKTVICHARFGQSRGIRS